MDLYKSSVPTTKRPTGKCQFCGKSILIASVRGEKSRGFCSRICAGMSHFKKRFKGLRSEQLTKQIDYGKYTRG